MPAAQWPLRINISEEEVWEPYDSSKAVGGNDVLGWASDNAWDDWRQIGRECLDIIRDLVAAYVPKSKAKKISEVDIRRICEAIKEDSADFQEIRQAFVDAATWAWEEAYTPSDGDLEEALENAVSEMIGDAMLPSYWSRLLNLNVQGPKDWSPLRSFTEADLLREIEAGISFEHEQNYFDRFVVFDVMDGPVMKYLRRKVRSGGLLDEDGDPVRVSTEDFETDVKDLLVDDVINKLDRHLQKVMEHVEPWQRVNFHKHWKDVLADKSRAKGVEEEILDWLKNHPEDPADAGLEGRR